MWSFPESSRYTAPPRCATVICCAKTNLQVHVACVTYVVGIRLKREIPPRLRNERGSLATGAKSVVADTRGQSECCTQGRNCGLASPFEETASRYVRFVRKSSAFLPCRTTS